LHDDIRPAGQNGWRGRPRQRCQVLGYCGVAGGALQIEDLSQVEVLGKAPVWLTNHRGPRNG